MSRMRSKSSITVFSVISITVRPRWEDGVTSTNSCTKLSPCEWRNMVTGSVLTKRRESGGRLPPASHAVRLQSRSSSVTRPSLRAMSKSASGR